MKFIKSVAIFGIVFFAIASIIYFLLAELFNESYQPLGGLYRMFAYHSKYPYQYILVVSIVYGIFATIWAYYFNGLRTWKKYISIVILLIITVIISSIPCGMLWVVHDTHAGFFPGINRFIDNIFWGAKTGLHVGWLIVAISIPYNLIMLVLSIIITNKISNLNLTNNLKKLSPQKMLTKK